MKVLNPDFIAFRSVLHDGELKPFDHEESPDSKDYRGMINIHPNAPEDEPAPGFLPIGPQAGHEWDPRPPFLKLGEGTKEEMVENPGPLACISIALHDQDVIDPDDPESTMALNIMKDVPITVELWIGVGTQCPCRKLAEGELQELSNVGDIAGLTQTPGKSITFNSVPLINPFPNGWISAFHPSLWIRCVADVSDTYNPDLTYNEGAVIFYNENIHLCNKDGVTGEFDSADWDLFLEDRYDVQGMVYICDQSKSLDVKTINGEPPLDEDSIATKLLDNPENPILTDSEGNVTTKGYDLMRAFLMGDWVKVSDTKYRILDPDDGTTQRLEIDISDQKAVTVL